MQYWQSPVLQLNLAARGVGVCELNSKLAAGIRTVYAEFVASNQDVLSEQTTPIPIAKAKEPRKENSDDDEEREENVQGRKTAQEEEKTSSPVSFQHPAADANNLFYKWQQDGRGYELNFAHRPEFGELMDHVSQCIRVLFKAVEATKEGDRISTNQEQKEQGKTEEGEEEGEFEFQAWATYHAGHASHFQHSHGEQLLSGVYYVKVPPSAGVITFHDPRGAGPPFNRMLHIQPRQGDVLLFPSWLQHSVHPTPGSDERISIAFNVIGSVDDLAELNAVSAVHPFTGQLLSRDDAEDEQEEQQQTQQHQHKKNAVPSNRVHSQEGEEL